MPLRLVNTTPRTVDDLVLPGTPLVFSLKSTSAHLDPRSLNVKMGFTNLIHRPNTLPTTNALLQNFAEVSLHPAERAEPSAGVMQTTLGASPTFIIQPRLGLGEVQDGVFEVKVPVSAFTPLLATVSFLLRPSQWPRLPRYWSDMDGLAPVYVGFEYGIKNTGLFVALRDDGTAGGSLVVGGPCHGYHAARPGQFEIKNVDWLNQPDGTLFTLFFLIDPLPALGYVWKQSEADEVPVSLGTPIPLGTLGTFLGELEAFPQRRAGSSFFSTLYFGNGGSEVEDAVTVQDFSIYQYYPQAVDASVATVHHTLALAPDLPFVFAASSKKLPSAPALGRWFGGGLSNPAVDFWFQPGRRTEPLYARITSQALGPSYLRRDEPCLLDRSDGFSVEAWMASQSTIKHGIDKGVGFSVSDGEKLFTVTGVDGDLTKTYGIVRDQNALDNLVNGFYLRRDAGAIAEADYSALRLVRLTVDRRRQIVNLFVEDPDVPFLSVPLNNVAYPFPAALSATDSFINAGVLGDAVETGTLNLAAMNFMNRYLAWEAGDGLPETSPVVFNVSDLGSGTSAISSFGTLNIHKTSHGPSFQNHHYYARNEDFTYLRGFQVDFRVRVASYSDGSGSQNTPNVWTGTGVTVFMGKTESIFSVAKKIHLGFFDCGAFGKKVAVVPHEGLDDILQQTARGQKYSASLAWDDAVTLRLSYRPYQGVEVRGSTLLKGPPLISIPWSEFECEDDPSNTTPSIAFGQFSPTIDGASEWSYLRWGIGSGYDVEIGQELLDPEVVQDGRVYAIIDADEFTGAVSMDAVTTTVGDIAIKSSGDPVLRR